MVLLRGEGGGEMKSFREVIQWEVQRRWLHNREIERDTLANFGVCLQAAGTAVPVQLAAQKRHASAPPASLITPRWGGVAF